MDSVRQDIELLYRVFLRREPGEQELIGWTARAVNAKLSFRQMFDIFVSSKEYLGKLGVSPGHPPGHYYSPIVNPDELKGVHLVDRMAPPQSVRGVVIDEPGMIDTFEAIAPFMAHRLPRDPVPNERYYWNNEIYPLGDAIVLSAMIGWLRPARIVEIGSGFSTACMLDAVDRNFLDTRISCVEPYASRLRSVMRPADAERLEIVEEKVQAVPLERFRALKANDILFIDSTHVMKTGSDVCHELFEILPTLAPGVVVHFHDIQYPFEYPDDWIFNKRFSWNEIYALRAFLMYNWKFRIIYFNDYIGKFHRARLERAYGAPVPNPGAGIWIRVGGAPGGGA